MRVIIAGSRSITDYHIVEEAVKESGIEVSVVISGVARGVDSLGEEYALRHGVLLERYPADWDRYGRSAGYIRNTEMASKADALIAIMIKEGSKGTEHMIQEANRCGLMVYVKLV